MKKIAFAIFIYVFFITGISALSTGDFVKYNDIEFYVVSSNDNYYTLMKAEPIKSDEIKDLISSTEIVGKINTDNLYALMAYYTSSKCLYSIDTSECDNNYESSNVKQIVDVWASKYLNLSDLVKDKLGYSYRLITYDEVIDDLGYEVQSEDTLFVSMSIANTPSFASIDGYAYWTMTSDGDNNNKVFLASSKMVGADVFFSHSVRPVVNVKKDKVELIKKNSLVDDLTYENTDINNKSYKKGDIVIYKGMKFYVLKDSINSTSLTLLKAQPLTVNEVKKYGSTFINNYGAYLPFYKEYDGFGRVAYYSSQTCGGVEYKESGCTPDYNKSQIKAIIDSWSKEKFNSNELVADDTGYKVRMLNENDIENSLFYVAAGSEITAYKSYYEPSDYTPKYNLVDCWTMTSIEDYNYLVLVQGDEDIFYQMPVYQIAGTICPVITVAKSNEIKENNEIVDSPDTYLEEPYISTVIGIIIISVISISFGIYIKMYRLKRK